MKRWIALISVLAMGVCALWPSPAFTEDRETVMLARAIYALCRQESYDVKLAMATVVMNRVESPWFADSIEGVLNEQHQFPLGRRYDAGSLSAAHAALAGERALESGAVYYQSTNATHRRADAPVKTLGGYSFYKTDVTL